MKTLKLISKTGNSNYFFGIPMHNKQTIEGTFTSGKELHVFLNEKAKNKDGAEMSWYKNV
jgi:hypothetical protein